MSDPLSVAGSLAGLVGLAIQLSQVSYQYVAGVKGSSKAWSSYIQELSALTSVLLQLQTASEAQERGSVLTIREPNVSKDAVDKCISELQQLKAKLVGKLARRGIKGKLDALVWPFSETDTQKKVDMLHRYHGLFSSALLADNFTVSIASYRELREQRQENEFKQVLDWFRPLSRPQQTGTISEQRCPGTGSSFLGHEGYLNWRDRSENCLWASGQPGVGKTVLSVAVLDDLRTSALKGAVIAYHSFRADNIEDSLQDLLRHLVFQGLSQCSDIVLEAAEVRRAHMISNMDPLPKDLVYILAAISKASSVMYVVLDGLDECQYLPKLARHLSTLRHSGMKILITSRDLPDVRKYLEGCPQIDVRPDRDDILRYVNWRLREDGEVEYELLEDRFKEDISSRLFEHADGSFLLVRLLMDHIGNLTTIKKIRKFLEALPSDYQEAYHRTFDRIMKHNAGRRELALKALNWVSNTKRPLTMRELQHAIAVEDSGDVVGDEDLESPKSILSSCVGLVRLSITDQRVELIHSSARSFIQKNQARVDPDADMTICRACFVYLSKLEMTSGPSTSLENFTRRLRSLPFLEYAARFYGYHVRSVEKRCVPELRQFLEDESLRESSWQVLHFAFSPHHVFGQDIFAGLPSHASILHVASYWGFSRLLATILEDSESLSAFTQADIDARDSHGWTPLHWAASMGQVDSAKLLLLSGATVDSLDSAQWTPLFWAAIKGYRDMASLLLSRGANVHQVDSDGMTPLHWSVSAGQDSTTHLLLETIERGNVREPDSHYTLRWLENREGLSISQAKQMVAPYVTSKSLLQLSAESLNSEGFSEFMRSAQRKAEQMNFYYGLGARDVPSIEPLFRTLWRVRNKNDWYFWLSKREKDPLVTFRAKLLERAIDGEQVSLVKALLDLDGDLRQDISKKVVSDNGDYYLHKACTRRNQEIAIALIAKGADVNQPAESGRTPLHYACQEGSSGVVKAILCEDSVNVDAKDERGQTSLMTLLQSGGWRIQHHPEENLEICTALIGHGASIYELCEDGNTTATIAVRLWDPAVIKLLVDSGIRFGKTKTGGMTPLHLAAIAPVEVSGGNSYWSRGVYDEAENYQIPSAAIEKTIDLVLSLADAADMRRTCRITCQADDFNRVTHHEGYRSACYEETALALATASENWVVARRLHELGARFKTDRPLYPLLIKATQAGIPELVQLLIQNGADINPPQTKGDGKTHNDEVSICVAVRSAKDCNRHEYNRGRRSRETPNHLATGDYLSVIHVLVGVGVDITSVDGHGMNALEYAVTRAVATDILQTLLDAGSNPHTPATSGFDHFQLALLNGSPSNLSCLWEYSKIHPAPASHWLHRSHSTTDPEEQDNPVHNFVIALSEACAINARDKYGHTLLFNAALAGNQAVAQELIICGANVNDTDPLGWTPIHAAVSQSDAEITSILLKAGADINGTLTDEVPWRADQSPKQDSKTAYKAIHLTLCKPGYHWNWEVQKPPSPEVVRLLLDSGADPNEAVTPPGYNYGKSTRTPIQLLFENHGYWEHTKEKSFKEVLEIAEMLIQKGAVVGDVALDLTVEHVAQFNGHEELWETLRKGMEGAKKEVNM